MKFIIPFGLFKAANICKARNDIRNYLNGVYVSKDGEVSGSNGHVCFRGNFVNSSERTYPPEKNLIIKPLTRVPTSIKIDTVEFISIEGSDKLLIVYKTLLGEEIATGLAELLDGKFPDLSKLFDNFHSKESKRNFLFGISASYMSIVEKMIPNKGIHWTVKLEIKDELTPVRIEMLESFKLFYPQVENAEALIMPMWAKK